MTVHIDAGELRDVVTAVFAACGLDAAGARAAADVVCYADEHGFTTHGTNALTTIYAPRLRDGRCAPGARPSVVRDAGGIAVVDGGGGLGLLAMTAATDLAALKAREHGVGLVAVRGSNHFGSSGFYTRRLSDQGLVGLALTNCGAQGVAPPLGGAVRMLGTNPISFAVPSNEHAPLVLDMSTTVVATGKLAAAQRQGEPVPPGWLHARDGATVTDPARYYDGTAEVAWLGGDLATGGAKGFGLGLLVDVLCGPLAGAAFGPQRVVLDASAPRTDSDIGHVALAIDPVAFGTDFGPRVDELLDTVRRCPPAVPGRPVTYPGEPEAAARARSLAEGVALPDAVAAALGGLADELSVPTPQVLTGVVAA